MIVAQITLHRFRGFGSLDVLFFEDMEFMSNELGAVWWEPSEGFSYLIFSSVSLWKDADPDITILKQAKAEYAELQ